MQNCQEDNDLHILMQEDLSFASEAGNVMTCDEMSSTSVKSSRFFTSLGQVYGPPREATGDDDDDDDDEPKVEDWMKAVSAQSCICELWVNVGYRRCGYGTPVPVQTVHWVIGLRFTSQVEEASPLLAGSFQDLPRTFLASLLAFGNVQKWQKIKSRLLAHTSIS